ncbi:MULTISPECIES: NTP transferase domain-containing protein [Streptomyces]|uniref:Molybdenum cofactor guanylyltransferase n=4 Tax=Streptomyces TaxID=1883 RepID=A0A8A1UN96_STRR1|nr:molybdopterin-guanine dinucleotide biosynthesis protein [Streptomyces rimosus]QGY65349.1 NTP transferase domain-containing protein [Streptomyces rimosus R6-500]QST82276.1 molybdenum cofactor guanylyltransferase [Streptomyces rimosus subsp. rimosus ATCC 10970]QTL87813.1 molybdenum cofactor guanylyltransferase [Streptomyces rimosus subsp. rimosus]QDA05702.1 molybdenum cofactor guanylyltransferase [Streptomyces rimosus]
MTDQQPPQDRGPRAADGALHGGAASAPADSGTYDVIVPAGGAARRLGGVDKPGLTVGGRSLLDRVLDACPDAATAVVVGPPRPTARPVVHTREEPPGGGPLAALDAGLRHTTAPVVLVLSADLPFLTGATVRALRAAAEGADAALLRDAEGKDQPLVAAYRAEPLRRALAAVRAERGTLAGQPLRALLAHLTPRRVPDPTATASFDCDTWEDIEAARARIGAVRARIREHGTVLDEWITAAKAELGIELDVDTAALLDLARDAAHGVARPAAPLTTFLVGYAAAQQGRDVSVLAAKAAALANRWAAEAAENADATPEAAPEAKPKAKPAK